MRKLKRLVCMALLVAIFSGNIFSLKTYAYTPLKVGDTYGDYDEGDEEKYVVTKIKRRGEWWVISLFLTDIVESKENNFELHSEFRSIITRSNGEKIKREFHVTGTTNELWERFRNTQKLVMLTQLDVPSKTFMNANIKEFDINQFKIVHSYAFKNAYIGYLHSYDDGKNHIIEKGAFENTKGKEIRFVGSPFEQIIKLLGENAFKNSSVKKICVGAQVIDKNAFRNCKATNIWIDGHQLKSVKKDAFKGITSRTTIKINAWNMKEYEKAKKMIMNAGGKKAKFKLTNKLYDY